MIWNNKTKKVIFVFTILLLMFAMSLFNDAPSFLNFSWIFLIAISLGAFLFAEDFYDVLGSLSYLFVIGSLIMVFVVWFSGTDLPFINKSLDNNSAMVLFTFVIAFATIFNYITYKKSVSLSRLSNLKIENKGDLNLSLVNNGGFDLRGIVIEAGVREKGEDKKTFWRDGTVAKSIFERIKKIFREEFDRYSKSIHLIEVGREFELGGIKKFIMERYNITQKTDDWGNISSMVKGGEKIGLVLDLKISYRSESFQKSPLPFFREYDLDIGGDIDLKER